MGHNGSRVLDIKANQDPEKSLPSLNKTFRLEPLSSNPGSYHLNTSSPFSKVGSQDSGWIKIRSLSTSSSERAPTRSSLSNILMKGLWVFFQIYGEIIQTAVGLEVEQAWAQVQSPGLNFRLAVNKPQAWGSILALVLGKISGSKQVRGIFSQARARPGSTLKNWAGSTSKLDN